jgi:leucyl-tRNA synthetase
MFIGDFEKAATWSSQAVKGCKRFLDKVWNLSEKVTEGDTYSAKNEGLLHKTIKKVTQDIDALKANTAIAALMSLVNELGDNGVNRAEFKTLLQLLSPFAPHIADELWEQHGFEGFCCVSPWPAYDEAKTKDAQVEMAIQVNGKFRGTLTIDADADDETVVAAALETAAVQKQLASGGQVRKTIVVKNKLINLIVK